MSKARQLADLGNVYDDGALSNRNLIINGAMQVWQRGTSQSNSGSYGSDRFWMANAASASRSTDVPSGFDYSTKLTYSASDMTIGQPIELLAAGKQGQLASGSIVTLSYYAKVDSGTEDIATSIKFRDSKFSSSNEVAFTPVATGEQNATWTTTWTRYTHSFNVPTASATNVMAALELSGISKDAYITGVQLEVGDTATPFEHRSYGQELALCQRYFTKLGGEGVGDVYGAGYITGAGFILDTLTLPVKMRTFPTSTVVGTWNVSNVAQPQLPYMSSTTAILYAQGTAIGQGLYNNPALTGYLTFDAEL